MRADLKTGRLGVAYYDADLGELSLSEVFEDDDFACLKLSAHPLISPEWFHAADAVTAAGAVKYQTNPRVILTCSSGLDEAFLRALPVKGTGTVASDASPLKMGLIGGRYVHTEAEYVEGTSETAQPERYKVEMLKSVEFSVEAARSRLASISVPAIPADTPPRDRLMQLRSFINFENALMVPAKRLATTMNATSAHRDGTRTI